MATTETSTRYAQPMPQPDGGVRYAWNLTSKEKSDKVVLELRVVNALPIVFVPGIMGTNLMSKDTKQKIWRLDTMGGIPVLLAAQKSRQGAGVRQRLLHPDRAEVDPGGNIPTKPIGSITDAKQYSERGWGEVGEGSYHQFLLNLEELFNGFRSGQPETAVEAQISALMQKRSGDDSAWRPQKDFVPTVPEDLLNLRNWLLPVYACGYNWLDDNAEAAKRLKVRIEQIIARHNNQWTRCEQVILITHSMGGLVSRACQQLDGMQDKIAGIVHGVMPANGAAVAYRRCKVGMREEDFGAGVVIGSTGQEVTAVFAQAPGALELLPTQHYQRGWLEVQGPDGKTVQKALHEADPYAEIYGRRDRWWALVKEEWLAPKDGQRITWDQYIGFLDIAKKFHRLLTPSTYHPNTSAFYGADDRGKTRSFERVVWRMKRGTREDEVAPSSDDVYGMTAQQVDMDGTNPEHVGKKEVSEQVATADGVSDHTYTVSHWELHAGMQDGTGDGTVPTSSGRAPADCAAVRQVFRLTGIEHEPAYRKSVTAQQVTVYAIAKIAREARLPKGTSSAAARG